MKKHSDRRIGFLSSAVIFFLLVISVSNCKEKVEGCLDIEATNFAFSADEVCPDDCCTYPTITFEFAFRWGSSPLIYSEPLAITFDTVINITKTKFYISDIRFTNETESFGVADRIDLELRDGSGTETFVDDFTLVSRDFSSFDYQIGEIRGARSFDTLRFVVGLNDQANKVDPDLAPDGHPLAIDSDTLWSVENKYVFNKLIVSPEYLLPNIKSLDFEVTEDEVEIVLAYSLDIEVGNNIRVPIIVDYYNWLRSIDFEVDSTSIVDEIVNNTAKAFSINE